FAEHLLRGRVGRQAVGRQAGLQETERAPDGVPAGQPALDVHRAPVELLGYGVDLEAVLEGGEGGVEVASLHTPLGQVANGVVGATSQVLTCALDPLPRVGVQQFAAVLRDRSLEGVD